MKQKIDNQQERPLSNKQLQVILTGTFGDGSIRTYKHGSDYQTNCIYKEYMEFKKELLQDLCTNEIKSVINLGYKQNIIHSIRTKSFNKIKITCNYFNYKRPSSTTIQKWSKLQVQLKKEGKTYNSHVLTAMMNKIVL